MMIEILGKCIDFYGILKDFQGSIIAIITIILTYPILKKKLLENHISNVLTDIQENNKKITLKCIELVDNYVEKTYNTDRIEYQDLIKIDEDLTNIQKISQLGNKDSNTLIVYLKVFIKNLIYHFDKSNKPIVFPSEIYNVLCDNLREAIQMATQVVQIPKSSKTYINNTTNDKIKKYVTNAEFENYKYFKQGVISEETSIHHLIFYFSLHNSSNNLLLKSGFEIKASPFPVLILMFMNSFYAPPSLTKIKNKDSLGFEEHLYLLSYRVNNYYGENQSEKTTVTLKYSNIKRTFSFTKTLNKEKIALDYNDFLIPNSNFDFSKTKSFKNVENEFIIIEYEKAYLDKMFLKNRKQIKKVLRAYQKNK